MSVQVSYKKQTLLGIFLILIVLIAIEGIVRGYEYSVLCENLFEHEAYQEIDFFKLKQICYDYKMIRYFSSPMIKPIPEQYSETVNINSFGFRGDQISEKKSDNTYRIIMIGGSTVFGTTSTADATTLPGYLQEFFRENEYNVEVINAGIPGTWSFYESYYIENHLKKFQPDLFIIYEGWNDAKRGNLFPELLVEKQSIGFKNFVNYRTPFVIYEFFFSTIYTPPDLYDEKTIVKLVDNWRDRWKSVCESGNKENFSVIVMVQPALGSGEKPLVGFEKRFSNIPDWHKQTLNIMQKMVDSLDSLEACSDTFDYTKILDGVNKPIFVDEIHLSDEGNKIIAREIFNDLIKSEMSNLIVKN